jgi:hypothetical protein
VGKRDNDGQVNLRYSVSTHVNITMYAPVQLLYANKKVTRPYNTQNPAQRLIRHRAGRPMLILGYNMLMTETR